MFRDARLRTLWDAAVTSLWFVPGLMVLGAVAIAAGGLGLDAWFNAGQDGTVPGWVFVGSTDDARGVLSNLLASMITMTSLVFSVTMVVLTLAANQFGPRLVRNFMGSVSTQVVLGTFVMTITYCLLVLPSIGWRRQDAPLIFASVNIAIGLMVISVVLLLLFIHSLARSIVSETVIDRVGRELEEAFDALPALPQAPSGDDPEDALPARFEDRSAFCGPRTAGYVQAVEFERLVATAAGADVLIGFHFRPGDYVARDGGGVAVCPGERLDEHLTRAIEAAMVIGVHRTPVQDLEFSIRHLVEIAIRALSPGTNDPYTAVAVLHRLSACLAQLMSRALPQAVFRDGAGVVRVVCPRPTYSGLIAEAFDQVRQNGADKPFVIIHLLEAITRIAPHLRRVDQALSLRKQLELALEDGERGIRSSSDRADIEGRAAKARAAIERAARAAGLA